MRNPPPKATYYESLFLRNVQNRQATEMEGRFPLPRARRGMWVGVGSGSIVNTNRQACTAVIYGKPLKLGFRRANCVSCEFFNEVVIKPKRKKLENSPFQAGTLRETSFTIQW